MAKYTVLKGTVHHNGKVYRPGEEVDMPEKEAQELKKLGFFNADPVREATGTQPPKATITKTGKGKGKTEGATQPPKATGEVGNEEGKDDGGVTE